MGLILGMGCWRLSSDVLFSQGVATYMLFFSFPTSNQDFRNGHSGLTSIYSTEGAASQLEITSLIHRKMLGWFFSFIFLLVGLFWHIWTLTVVVPCMGWALTAEKWLSFALFRVFLIVFFTSLFCSGFFFLPHFFCYLLTCIPWIFALLPFWLSPIPLKEGVSEWLCVGLCCQPGWNHGRWS